MGTSCHSAFTRRIERCCRIPLYVNGPAKALLLAVELWYAPRHSQRSCPRRALVACTTPERYALGGPVSPQEKTCGRLLRVCSRLRLPSAARGGNLVRTHALQCLKINGLVGCRPFGHAASIVLRARPVQVPVFNSRPVAVRAASVQL